MSNAVGCLMDTKVNIIVPRKETTQSLSLTSVCCVHSNDYDLINTCSIRYYTTVEPIHSTYSSVQAYHHLASDSAKIPLATTAGDSSSIGEEPVSYGTSIRRSATSRLVSHTEQTIITFTNILKGHKTVVLVCHTSQPETDVCTCGKKRG